MLDCRAVWVGKRRERSCNVWQTREEESLHSLILQHLCFMWQPHFFLPSFFPILVWPRRIDRPVAATAKVQLESRGRARGGTKCGTPSLMTVFLFISFQWLDQTPTWLIKRFFRTYCTSAAVTGSQGCGSISRTHKLMWKHRLTRFHTGLCVHVLLNLMSQHDYFYILLIYMCLSVAVHSSIRYVECDALLFIIPALHTWKRAVSTATVSSPPLTPATVARACVRVHACCFWRDEHD